MTSACSGCQISALSSTCTESDRADAFDVSRSSAPTLCCMNRVLIIVGAPIGRFDHRAARIVERVDHRLGSRSAIALGTMDFTSAVRTRLDARTTGLRLRNGSTLGAAEFGAVLNLVRFPEIAVTDLLHSMQCRVINGPDAGGRRGAGSPELWPTIARRCGLDTAGRGIATGTRLLTQRVSSLDPSRASTGPTAPATTTVTVVGDRVFGARSPVHSRQCRRFARLVGCELLGLTFGPGPRHFLVAADPFPTLDGHVADAVAALLCDRAGSDVIAVAG